MLLAHMTADRGPPKPCLHNMGRRGAQAVSEAAADVAQEGIEDYGYVARCAGSANTGG